MTQHTPPSDEQLVAYLDGELDPGQCQIIDNLLGIDPAMAARVEQLKRGDLSFKPAFDSVLDQAPTERLQAMLDSLPSAQTPTLSRRRFLAVAASFAVAGVVADRLFMAWPRPEPGSGWRASVAEYMALYTPQTLENLSTDPESHIAQLSSVGRQLGLPLSPEAINLPGAAFRRAQILDYDGVLIGQLTYLDPRHGPLALCITAAKNGAVAMATEQRRGLNVVFWSSPTHAFMLIGRNPFEDLQIMARSAEKSLAV
ncbi:MULTISPECIES: anti-sigma factor [unclassified Pseudomonas]|uniref:anti-sigma factor family protein n=1 Tax=unclassified Pseudomonas TaxID=196821 RepID=UPI0015A44806|nr:MULTISPECIES: transcriptional regulator [unclassified Pseudomonas]NWC90878.1 transcriptional regulator [Pseudomonas sp. IPO3779]NWD17008.1 transcriptional regulator [Pseudomonas sp. IPO3778]